MSQLKVSIIIVHYQRFAETLRCIKSIYENKDRFLFEVILVDNNNLAKEKVNLLNKDFSALKYIKSPKNLGYGAGNNLGAKHARGEYLFILNPDTKVLTYAVDNLVSFLEEKKEVGIVAPNLLDSKGKLFSLQGTRMLTPLSAIFSLSLINKIFPNNPISRSYWMKEVSKKNLREVDVIPGSAFLIRRDIFEKVGGFDENFFLYFEEADFCKRIKNLGYKIFMIPDAKVVHYWKPAEGKRQLKKIFEKSRFYYFKKHYGFFKALFVEVFTRISAQTLALSLILITAIFLRFRKLEEIPFIGEFGWYYIQARDMLLTGSVPLVGLQSSVPFLRQGALWAWMLALALKLGRFNPFSGVVLTIFLGILGVLGVFFVGFTLFNKRVGIISSFLSATSPIFIYYDRLPFFTAAIFPLTILVTLSLIKIFKGFENFWFFLGFGLAIIYQFGLSTFIMLPVVFSTIFWEKIKISSKNLLKFILGGAIGILPFILWDIEEIANLQILGFLVWLNMKVYENFVLVVLLILSVILFFYILTKKLKHLGFGNKFITSWLVFGILGLGVGGVFSQTYLPIIFLPVVTFCAVFFDWLISKKIELGIVSLLVFTIFNSFFSRKILDKTDVISLSKRISVAKFIVKDSSGRRFALQYLGPGYNFNFGDNHWKYIFWWLGNEPEKEAKLMYMIAEHPYSLIGEFDKTYYFGKISVGKKND